ncbi:hypothetical protein M011DRAFT_463393 [Sporormia fimetaria CBS 119925]|uniref:Uncharacterized protein n=1 Tax=Sporormia fimetaria CBS 119925 TaxID=1340428 RepID=A0A6A6VRK0_9PLEO|nr:hypothetical protein M011DRAFT_463393 [Sporormia fimetaria CBS 119925]
MFLKTTLLATAAIFSGVHAAGDLLRPTVQDHTEAIKDCTAAYPYMEDYGATGSGGTLQFCTLPKSDPAHRSVISSLRIYRGEDMAIKGIDVLYIDNTYFQLGYDGHRSKFKKVWDLPLASFGNAIRGFSVTGTNGQEGGFPSAMKFWKDDQSVSCMPGGGEDPCKPGEHGPDRKHIVALSGKFGGNGLEHLIIHYEAAVDALQTIHSYAL